jgi:hypothetical protein
MTNIVPITKHGRRMLNLSLDQLIGFEGVKILAGLIQEWHLTPEALRVGRGETHRGQLKYLAAKANLTPRTVSKIMHRETRAPQMLTCIMLFKALGFSAVRFE